MATPVRRIEKEFLLKVLYDEQLPIVYLQDRTEYTFVIERPARDEILLQSNRIVPGLKLGKKLNLMFDYHGQVLSFSVEITSIRLEHIKTTMLESFYKNLDRSYLRVSTPPDLQVQFTFLQNRYSLTYPRISEYENEEMDDVIRRMDLKNLSGLIEQMAAWIRGIASGHKLVIFKDIKPSFTEEWIVAETGKTLYLPVVNSGFPTEDPYPRKRLIMADVFKRHLESTGVDLAYVDEAAERFIKTKYDGGIISDAWVPILFQEYVIGYIHIWINKFGGKSHFDFRVLDTLYQFAKILSFSLKENGYFDNGLLRNDPFDGKVIDISVSGLLFAYPHSNTSSLLLPESKLSVQLVTPRQTIETNSYIVRRYKDRTMGYFGCHFADMDAVDRRFLFEFIYGRPFTEVDELFLAGQV